MDTGDTGNTDVDVENMFDKIVHSTYSTVHRLHAPHVCHLIDNAYGVPGRCHDPSYRAAAMYTSMINRQYTVLQVVRTVYSGAGYHSIESKSAYSSRAVEEKRERRDERLPTSDDAVNE